MSLTSLLIRLSLTLPTMAMLALLTLLALLIGRCVLLRPRRLAGRAVLRLRIAYIDLRAVAQAIDAIDDDILARL